MKKRKHTSVSNRIDKRLDDTLRTGYEAYETNVRSLTKLPEQAERLRGIKNRLLSANDNLDMVESDIRRMQNEKRQPQANRRDEEPEEKERLRRANNERSNICARHASEKAKRVQRKTVPIKPSRQDKWAQIGRLAQDMKTQSEAIIHQLDDSRLEIQEVADIANRVDKRLVNNNKKVKKIIKGTRKEVQRRPKARQRSS